MGEPVALVVADDPYMAWDALELIDVVYEPLPVCASVTDALAPGAPRLFPGTDSNNVATITMRVGDADAALGRRRPRRFASASPIRGRRRPRSRRAGSSPCRPIRAAASCT